MPADAFGLGLLILAGFAAVLCMGGLSGGPSMGDHEALTAQMAREIRETGEWLIPTFVDELMIHKTPLGPWSVAFVSYLTDTPDLARPVSQFSARFPSALAGVLAGLVVCGLGASMFGRSVGLTAGLVMAAGLGAVVYAHNATVDMLLTLLVACCYACFWKGTSGPVIRRGWMALFYICLAAACMAKAPLPLAVVGLPLAVYWLVVRPATADVYGLSEEQARGISLAKRIWVQFAAIPKLWIIPGVAFFLILAGAWPLYVYTKVDGALDLWYAEYVVRYAGGLTKQVKQWYYYLPLMFGMAAPFLLSLPEALVSPFLRAYRSDRRSIGFLLTWIWVGIAFLSSSSFKRPHYLLPIVPALSLLLAPVLHRLFWACRERNRAKERLGSLVLGAFVIALFGGACLLGPVFVKGLERSACVPVAAVAVLCFGGACLLFGLGLRRSSFALLVLGVPALFFTAWPEVGRRVDASSEPLAVVAALQQAGVERQDRIYWIDDSPTSYAAVYYGEYRIERLMTRLERAAKQHLRSKVSVELQLIMAERVLKKLAEEGREYFILSAGNLSKLKQHFSVEVAVVARVHGFHKDPDDELLVFTQSPDRSDGEPGRG